MFSSAKNELIQKDKTGKESGFDSYNWGEIKMFINNNLLIEI